MKTLVAVLGLVLGLSASAEAQFIQPAGGGGSGGGGGTSSNFGSAFPSAGTAIGVKNGASMVNLTADGSNNLNVNCAVGCSGGSFNNNADAVATSATNGQAASWLYGFNGATWDRLRVDGNKALSTNLADVAGTATATGSGAMNAGTQRMALATDSPGVIPFGQAAMSASIPVAIASNQTGVPVTIATAPVLVAGSAIIGKVGVDQTTPGTTNGVALTQIGSTTTATGNGTAVGAGVQRVALGDMGTGEYETVAASQTAQALGATGATGDYLFQLVCAPATTSPGVVTVLDNASAVVSFAGGATSVSNLIPFVIPVNAYSVSGAWKVTTGANISCVGVGNFT